jgi:hypothetical protein
MPFHSNQRNPEMGSVFVLSSKTDYLPRKKEISVPHMPSVEVTVVPSCSLEDLIDEICHLFLKTS